MILQNLVANLDGGIRQDTMEGREYTVAPMVMAVEGVLNGSGGALFYPGEELAKMPVMWNHKPVVVYHPKINGLGVSACDPDICTAHKVGIIMNTKYEDGKLKAEAWLEQTRIAAVDPRIGEALENNTMMELSTGLFTDNVQESGNFEGSDYVAIAKNYRPDHLALLPDQKGACSIEDGAGFIRMNEAGDTVTVLLNDLTEEQKERLRDNTQFTRSVAKLVLNDLSFGDIRDLLSGMLRETQGDDTWIEDVFEDYIVYERGGTLHKQPYVMADGEPKFEGLPEDVIKSVTYITANNSTENERESDMDKKAKVEALIANAETQWGEDDKPYLMGLEENVLDKMAPVANTTEEVVADKTETTETTETAEEVVANKQTEKVTVDAYIANAPAELQPILRNSVQSYAAEKKRLINTITANDKNTFTTEQLAKMEVDALAPIAALCSNAKTETPLQDMLNFSGMGEVVQNIQSSHTEEAMPMVNMTFGDESNN